MTKWKKNMAAVLAVLVLVIMLFSVIYVATESNHQCEGSDCPICHQISICEHVLKTLSAAAGADIIWFVFGQQVYQVIYIVLGFIRRDTLVSLKVKLSD